MKKFNLKDLVFIALLPFVFSCNNSKQVLIEYMGYTQGTTFSIKFYASSDTSKLKQGIDSILYEINRTASTYDTNSIISKVNKNLDVKLNDDFIKLFNRSREISVATEGCFDITVGELVKRWGFGFKNKQELNQKQVDSLLKFVGYQNISIENGKIIKRFPDITIDYNAIAQGYTVDLVAEYLLANQCNDFIVEIGGEVRANGKKHDGKPWIVGIEKPVENEFDDRVIQEKININNKSISTSGNYRKFFVKDGIKYSHTIDPKTGYPVHHSLLSVSILANDCTTADAYATAFMVMGVDKAKEYISQHPGIEAYFIYSDSTNNNKVYCTDGFFKH